MDVRAIVAVATGKPLEISTVQVDGPCEGEVWSKLLRYAQESSWRDPTSKKRPRRGSELAGSLVIRPWHVTRYIRLLGI
jgi:hypothetical protein